MRREAAFDPTDHTGFDLQRQRLDWQLLQNGYVHRYDDRFALDTACGHLADLSYLVHAIDAFDFHEFGELHTAMATALSFPAYYGRNLDALNDVLRDVAEFRYGSDNNTTGTVLSVSGFEVPLRLDRVTAVGVLDVFARRAQSAALFGHPMLCLIETTDDDLGLLGGSSVLRETVAEFPPDPPDPFDEDSVIVFGFQFFADAFQADRCAAALTAVVGPILDRAGRFQVRADLASERDGQSDTRHRSSRRQRVPGQQLYDIDVAFRGHGDRSTLGESVFRAVSDAKIPFERATETAYIGADLSTLLVKYPALDANP